MNKWLFSGIVSAFLLGLPASFALNLNPQQDVICGINSCSLTIDLSKYLTTKQITSLKEYNISAFLDKKNLDLKYSWSGSSITFYAKIAVGSSQYWTFNSPLVTIDPWFNSSLPYCNNLSYTTTSTANYTGRVVRFNITNMTGFNTSNGSDVYFSNDTIDGLANAIELPHLILDYSANSWFSGFVRLDYINNNSIRNISYCYGNLTTERSDGNKVFNVADTSNGQFDNFSATGVLNSTMWNNTSTVTTAGGVAWVNGTGAWHEMFTRNNYNTSFCLVTNITFKDTTSSSQAVFGVASASGGAPLNAYQCDYPTVNTLNIRNYVGADGGGLAEFNKTTGTFEVCRNNSAFNVSYAQFRQDYSKWQNFTGAQIINSAKDFRWQELTNTHWMAIDYAIIWFNPYPEPTATYYSQETEFPYVAPLNPIVDGSMACFTIVPVCVKLQATGIPLYFKDDKVII